MELARDLRPQNLKEIWGNKSMVNSLQKFVENFKKGEKGQQTFLFTGPKGCGKTTTARVLCNELGISGDAITEINGSNDNGIDYIRGFLDTLEYKSIHKNRAVIFDECHGLTADAQRAFLKTLEEPPRGVYFFFCTTDPQKLSAAFLSRFTKYQVNILSEDELIDHLDEVCEVHKLDVSVDVVDKIVEVSGGTPRDALKLLDQVKDMSEKESIKLLNNTSLSFSNDDPDVLDLCRKLLKCGSWQKEIAPILVKIKASNAEGVRRQILGYMNSVLLKSGNPEAAIVMSYFIENFYDGGMAQLTYACYGAITELKNS